MVHQYKLNNYNIVLDTCSGSIHVVDEVAYDVIELFSDHSEDEIVSALLKKYASRPDVTEAELRQCVADVRNLKDGGKLWTPDTFAGIAGTFKERSGDVVKALCLHVAHSCNLNLLLRQPGQIPRRTGAHVLRGGQTGPRLPDGPFRHAA